MLKKLAAIRWNFVVRTALRGLFALASLYLVSFIGILALGQLPADYGPIAVDAASLVDAMTVEWDLPSDLFPVLVLWLVALQGVRTISPWINGLFTSTVKSHERTMMRRSAARGWSISQDGDGDEGWLAVAADRGQMPRRLHTWDDLVEFIDELEDHASAAATALGDPAHTGA